MDGIPLKSLVVFIIIWLIIALRVIVRPAGFLEAFLVAVVYCAVVLCLVRDYAN